jgi:ABC-type Fe3+-hydroxamate transport system substrate-binding protein
MSIGHDTFIHAMLEEMKIENIFGDHSRYPTFELEAINTNPDFIMLSSEPYPFKTSDIDYFQKYWPHAKILLVDGEYFSWYGSRVVGAFKYFDSILDLQQKS